MVAKLGMYTSTERTDQAANEVRELSEDTPERGSTARVVSRALGLGALGLAVGIGSLIGSVLLVEQMVPIPLRYYHWWVPLVFLGTSAIFWCSLSAWLVRRASVSLLWWVASAASWTAAVFAAATLLLGLFMNGFIAFVGHYHHHPGPVPGIIALGAALVAYVLVVRRFLWNAVVGGERL